MPQHSGVLRFLVDYGVPLFVYLYARYKSLTDNPAILNHIENTKAGINRFLHDLSNQNSTVLLRAQRRGLMRYGLIGLGLSVLLLLVPGSQHYQLPVLWLTALSFLSVWESFCLEWVFEHRTAYKDYAKAYAVVALFPLLVFVARSNGTDIVGTTEGPRWIVAPGSIWEAIGGALCMFAAPYLFLWIFTGAVVIFQIVAIWFALRTLRVLGWINSSYLDVIVTIMGALWVLKLFQ